MHSDVVGNVFFKSSAHPVVRVGHDGAESGSDGRYRFVNNTFLLSGESRVAIQAYGRLQSIEATNNVFHKAGGGRFEVVNDDKASWTTGKPVWWGASNWVSRGASCPDAWEATRRGEDPGFTKDGIRHARPSADSPLMDAGISEPPRREGFELPDALFPPAFEPPPHRPVAPWAATRRVVVGALDLGALEFAESR
jgi:hypothetical protein